MNRVISPLILLAAILQTACAPLDPQRPPEVRTQTVEIKVPIPVPCFTEAERPVLPPPTPIDLEHATPSQKAAANAADDINETNFRALVDALFLKCVKPGGTK